MTPTELRAHFQDSHTPIRILEERLRVEALKATPAKIIASKAEAKQIGLPISVMCPDKEHAWRFYIVVAADSATVRLFSPANLTARTISRHDFDQRSKPVKIVASRTAARLAATIALHERINDQAQAVVVADAGPDSTAALAILESQRVY